MNHSLKIMIAASETCRVPVSDMQGSRRHQNLTWARFIAMDLMRKRTNLSYPQIGRLMGNRDHTTVMSGVKRAKQLRFESDLFALLYEASAEKASEMIGPNQ